MSDTENESYTSDHDENIDKSIEILRKPSEICRTTEEIYKNHSKTITNLQKSFNSH